MKGETESQVRRGEELDVAAVHRWLLTVLPELDGTPTVTQYSGGASNWTYRLRYRNRDLVLRRPPAGTKAKSAHDMSREYRIQSGLRPSYPVVPAMVGLCQDPTVLGTEFYVMDRIDGLIPRRSMPDGVDLNRDEARRLCTNLVDKFVELHQVDYRAAGLESLARGPGYPRRQVDGWTERYQKARTWNVPSMEYVSAWLKEHTPGDAATCVIHNDYRFDNVVLDPGDPTRIVGVLDWEMATIGDPLMDLGNSLAYWVHADADPISRLWRSQPTNLPGMMRREEVVERYLGRTGLRPENWTFYEVFGVFRIAVIMQQIYYRYHHRQTRNPEFKNFWTLAHYLDWRCRSFTRKSRRTGGG